MERLLGGLTTAPKTLTALGLLALGAPFNLAITLVALIAGLPRRWRGPNVASGKTILVSGGKMTKALQLARSFHAAGHRVVLVESDAYWFTGHRFSNAVSRFHTVPKPDAPGYAQALLAIVEAEGIDVYVPVCSPVASQHDAVAKALLSRVCEVVHFDADVLATLDDKSAFSAAAQALGLTVPDFRRITHPRQVKAFDFEAAGRSYILKSIAYDPVQRLDLTRLPRPTQRETDAFVDALPISEDNPWILQEFIEGREYCTHGTVRNGSLTVYGCCQSSAFQLNYGMVDKPLIEQWVRTFVSAPGLTGQASFDFIEASDGRPYAIECNPRTHSAITMFHDHADVARSYLEDAAPLIRPLPTSRPTYWLYHELSECLRRPGSLIDRIRTIARGKEAIFDWRDPLPFLMVHHAHIPALLIRNLFRMGRWTRIDFNIGKLIEPGGD